MYLMYIAVIKITSVISSSPIVLTPVSEIVCMWRTCLLLMFVLPLASVSHYICSIALLKQAMPDVQLSDG